MRRMTRSLIRAFVVRRQHPHPEEMRQEKGNRLVVRTLEIVLLLDGDRAGQESRVLRLSASHIRSWFPSCSKAGRGRPVWNGRAQCQRGRGPHRSFASANASEARTDGGISGRERLRGAFRTGGVVSRPARWKALLPRLPRAPRFPRVSLLSLSRPRLRTLSAER